MERFLGIPRDREYCENSTSNADDKYDCLLRYSIELKVDDYVFKYNSLEDWQHYGTNPALESALRHHGIKPDSSRCLYDLRYYRGAHSSFHTKGSTSYNYESFLKCLESYNIPSVYSACMWEQDPSYLDTTRCDYISNNKSAITDAQCAESYAQRSDLNARFPSAYGPADLWMAENLPMCQKFVFDYERFFSCIGDRDPESAKLLQKDSKTGRGRAILSNEEIQQGLERIHGMSKTACE